MKKNKIALQIAAFSIILVSFIGCDKDFATLDSDVINEENATNFDIESQQYDIITYNEVLPPVQTNNFNLSSLGTYTDDYGKTTASFVTQVSLSNYDPTFGEEVEIDSVVLTMPYFSTVINVDEEGNITYRLDSVFGDSPFNLKIYESDYFIRDFDPNGDFNDSQDYFSDMSASEAEPISESILTFNELDFIENPTNENSVSLNADGNIDIRNTGIVLTEPDNEDEDTQDQVLQRLSPSLRLKLDPQFWQEKIIDQEGNSVLSSQNNFAEYFRGLYFKAEQINQDDSNFILFNTGIQNSNITIYYSRLTASTTDDEDEREQNTLVLTFNPRKINFLDNDFTLPLPTDPDSENGDPRLYLKGGEGSLAKIKLFDGDGVNDGDNMTFDDFKEFFVETDEEGDFVRSRRLVNEANLVFYVDQSIVQDNEPNRIYLYDAENNTPLVDYFLDGRNNSLPSFSIINHLGPLQRVNDEPNGQGIKYKLKLTEHINNLLLRDSTNVELGLSVALNVNLEEQFPQRSVKPEDSQVTVPLSSVISPRGTVLHGNATEDLDKKVYLEIFYTDPTN